MRPLRAPAGAVMGVLVAVVTVALSARGTFDRASWLLLAAVAQAAPCAPLPQAVERICSCRRPRLSNGVVLAAMQ